jgi:hypothetical protein
LLLSNKLDFVHLGSKSECVGWAVEKGLGHFYNIGIVGRHPQNGHRPKMLVHEGTVSAMVEASLTYQATWHAGRGWSLSS